MSMSTCARASRRLRMMMMMMMVMVMCVRRRRVKAWGREVCCGSICKDGLRWHRWQEREGRMGGPGSWQQRGWSAEEREKRRWNANVKGGEREGNGKQ
eukprot:3134942-Rhodomonas_salina.2